MIGWAIKEAQVDDYTVARSKRVSAFFDNRSNWIMLLWKPNL